MNLYRFKKRFITEKARFNKGYGEISWIKGIYETFLLLYVASSIGEFDIPTVVYVVAPFLVFLGLWLVGFLWDKSHLFNIEREFGNERDYFVKEMRKALGKGKLK